MSLITIEQLLESVDLDFEPSWITKDEDGRVEFWSVKPHLHTDLRLWIAKKFSIAVYRGLKLAEFEGKNWTECIYEVPRKTTRNEIEQKMLSELERKLNAIVDAAIDAINELKAKEQ